MPITSNCPGCGTALTFPDQAAGRKAKCKSCGVVLTVPAPRQAVAPEPSSPVSPPSADGGLMLGMLEEDMAARKKREAEKPSKEDERGAYAVSEPQGEAPSRSRLAALTALGGGDPDRVGGLGVRAKSNLRPNSGPVSALGELAEGLAGIVSLLFSIGGIGYAMFASVKAVSEVKGAESYWWIPLTLYAALITLFFVLVVPGCIGAMKITSMILKFELPESPYYRMAVVVCFPMAMVTLGRILGGDLVAVLMGIAGCLLATFVLWLMYRLRPLEWLLGATLTSIAFVPLVIATLLGSAVFTGWVAWRVKEWDRAAEIARAREEAKKKEEANPKPKPPVLFDLVSETQARTAIPADAPAMTITQEEADRLDVAVALGNVSLRLPRDMSLVTSDKQGHTFKYKPSASQYDTTGNDGVVIVVNVNKRVVADQHRPIVGWAKTKSEMVGSTLVIGSEYADNMHGFSPYNGTTTDTAIDYVRIDKLSAARATLTQADRKREIEHYTFFDGPSVLSVIVDAPKDKAEQLAFARASIATLRKVNAQQPGFGTLDDPQTLFALAARGYDDKFHTIQLGPKHHEAILAAAESPDVKIRAFAMRWLPVVSGEKPLELLKGALKDESPLVRLAAMESLETKMNVKVDPVTKFLTQVTLDNIPAQKLLKPICGDLALPNLTAGRRDPFRERETRREREAGGTTNDAPPPTPADEPRRAEVHEAIAKRFESANVKEVWIWAMALGTWGDASDAAILRAKLNQPDLPEDAKMAITLGLARLKDPETRNLLIDWLRTDKPGAAEGLVYYAPGIEKDVLSILRQSDASARQGIEILSRIGTRQCLPTLNAIVEGNSYYAPAARAAADAVRERLKTEKEKEKPADGKTP